MNKSLLSELQKYFDETNKIPENLIGLLNTISDSYDHYEKKLEQTEKRFRTLIDNSNDIIIEIDAEKKITYVSESANHIMGYTPAEMLGKQLVEFPYDEDLPRLLDEFFEVLQNPGKTFYKHYRVKHKTRGFIWVEGTIINLLHLPEINSIIINQRDITHRKEVIETITLSEERYRYLFNNNPLPIIIFDFSTLQILQVNDAAIQKYGYTNEEFLTLNIRDIRPKEDIPHIENITKDEATYSNVSERLWRYLKKNGEIMYMNVTGNIIDYNGKRCALALLQDVTEKKIAETAIRNSEEKTRLIMNAALDAIICIDTKGLITFWNPRAEKIFGWKAEEVKGRLLSETIIPEAYREMHINSVEDYLKTGHGPALNVLLELSAFKKSNEEFPIELTILPIKQDEEEFFCAVVRDITERKKNEVTLKDLNSQIIKRAEELEQFAYIASHDLQEPLRMVTSFLTQLEKKYQDKLDHKAQQYIYFAKDGAIRMRKIILDLLEYSRIGTTAYHIETVDLNELLFETVQLNRTIIEEKKAVIEWENLPKINAAKLPLQQVLQNLLGNALKYQKPNEQALIGIKVDETEECWQFSISDNGIGIDPQFYDKIFIVFQRLHNKNEYSGTGIGLAICKKIIENHKGKIWVDSAPGEGSTFHFTISKQLQ